MPKARCHPCDNCGDNNPDSFKGATKKHKSKQEWLCTACLLKHREEQRVRTSSNDALMQKAHNRLRKEKRILSGAPRSRIHASYRCVADPDDMYFGSYFYRCAIDGSLDDGSMPTGSLWINDHTHKVFEVLNTDTKKQVFLPVSRKRLKLLESRFPRLRRALSNPAVC